MSIFSDSVTDFLEDKGFHCKNETHSGIEVLKVKSADFKVRRSLVLLGISAYDSIQAAHMSYKWEKLIRELKKHENQSPIIITEDIWNRKREMSEGRLLAHLEIFFPIYARNCEVRKIDKAVAGDFLARTHTYGDASCRHRYGLYLKRHTGHIAASSDSSGAGTVEPSTLVAVATFSNARKWVKGDRTIRSYEWTRYASLPGIRVNGGMGKLLKAFIKDIRPDDIMSYADLEWSEGKVYEYLGFILEGNKEPVDFIIDPSTWERRAYREPLPASQPGCRFFRNFGSAKYRLKLIFY